VTSRRAPERGQAAVFLIGTLVLAVAFVGVAVDGARLFTARRDLSAVADSAALAGASAIDEQAYRASRGTQLRLDPDRARAAAVAILDAANLPPDTQVQIASSTDAIEVRISRPVPAVFLRVVGLTSETIGAHARAAPRRSG
jgi:Flp pilus assembly protein TadG